MRPTLLLRLLRPISFPIPACFYSISFSTVAAGTPSPKEAPPNSALALATPSYVIEELPQGPSSNAIPRSQGKVKGVRGHTKKLNPVARQVTGLSVNEAMAQMAFSSSNRAEAVSRVLVRASKQAEIFHQLKRAELMVEAAWTGKQSCSRRIRHHSKGRAGLAHKRTSQISVRLRKMTSEEAEKLNKFKRMGTLESRAALDPRGY